VLREMNEKTRQLFSIFKDAVQRERDAQALYRKAADLCEDKELRELLVGLCKDEARHEKTLVQRYNRLAKKYALSPSTTCPAVAEAKKEA
jgi:rubrerythrin